MLLAHNDLKNYYEVIFAMAQHYQYSITDLENILPYELEIYVGLLKTYQEKLKEEQAQANLKRGIK